MLKALRKNTKIIIWTVVIAFVLWGGFAVGTQFQNEGRIAGKLFGKDVFFQEFDRFYRASQIFSFTGTPIEDPEMLRQHAWESIMLSREAQRMGIEVEDQEVREEVLRILRDQKIEDPTPEFYKRWVQSTMRQSPNDFEAQLRELLRIQKLVRKINTQPVEEPAEDRVRREFSLDYNELSLEIIRFPTQAEAEAFAQEHGTLKDWKQAKKEGPDRFKTTGLISLDAVINLWNIPESEAFLLHGKEKDALRGPVPVSSEFAMLRVLDQKSADESKFTEELKESYREKLRNQSKYARFLSWSLDLKQRSGLEDFLPPLSQNNNAS